MSLRRSLFAALVLLAAVPCAALATRCFPGRPLPDCEAFWALEFRSAFATDGGSSWGSEVGRMVNRDGRTALGASVALELRRHPDWNNEFQCGPAFRYRRWLNGRFTADLATGPLLSVGSSNTGTIDGRLDAMIGYRDGLSAGARLEVRQGRDSGPSEVHLGGTVTAAGDVAVALHATVLLLVLIQLAASTHLE